jgi:hypothetical protein
LKSSKDVESGGECHVKMYKIYKKLCAKKNTFVILTKCVEKHILGLKGKLFYFKLSHYGRKKGTYEQYQ